ncbi:HORMA domain-containing protein 2 isoform X1 [Pantherophis guttatus]|uniref:HORMA domain-containing protein 2 isoform X1 n=1 Tax=Pantherophis guttatus TaxID=94885 RepID=A0A6P9CCL6_PANGU|nr:HORMA domain-containing protein 2 isoform X1 [Pantherophis guttatus]XP_034282031.2 HORMA domain-containing protein 2 isoform X1 [Pantherophis guttatus]XP_034282033.2 HORMA domain-containing protein 2 isoform X1 [Pantherophis guttatus]XP_060541120.1 HORMA domain-containing protein 2 isoform X1 [Pantherophis guttatus]XP_060541121.1 HORMA domain-containing protein 2 isoform X1 [Pantherophis guttatus]
MATAQITHIGQKHKTLKETALFPSRIASEQESLVLVKRLLAVSISCISYLRGLFPESSYGTCYLEDIYLKILREDKSCQGSLQVVKWIQGCFDALEKNYLHMAVLAIYTNPKDPEHLTEFYQFKFKYTKNGPQMDFTSSQVSFHNGTNSKEIKKASILLIRKLYILMQHLGPLPNDITLTMKLFYYKDVTPIDYQPHGFKEGDSSDGLLFDGDPVNLKVGSVSTGFHVLKVRVTTDSKRMGMLENSLVEENGPTEISHQGLDCDDEEEEEDSTKAPEQRKFMAAYVDKNRMFEENAVSQHMPPLNPDITETIRKDGAEETEKECGTKTSHKVQEKCSSKDTMETRMFPKARGRIADLLSCLHSREVHKEHLSGRRQRAGLQKMEMPFWPRHFSMDMLIWK